MRITIKKMKDAGFLVEPRRKDGLSLNDHDPVRDMESIEIYSVNHDHGRLFDLLRKDYGLEEPFAIGVVEKVEKFQIVQAMLEE